MDYGGAWSVEGGAYWNAGGNGDKAVAGSTGWTDYTLTADIALTAAGRAGLLVRVSDPDMGADALHGYYVGLETATGTSSSARGRRVDTARPDAAAGRRLRRAPGIASRSRSAGAG